MKMLKLLPAVLLAAMILASCSGKGSGGGQTSEGTKHGTVSASGENTTVLAATLPETEHPVTTTPQTDEPAAVDFSDTLFIGDSRTAGLYLYGRIDGAKYFARTSMNVFNCFNDKPSETGTGDAALEEYLSTHEFGKIYILLGINEIGYPYDSIINGYDKLVGKLKTLQPQARIVIQSNMYVTKEKSDANPKTFSNDRINTLNERLEKLCGEKGIFFLDIAPAFDDGN